MHYDIIAAVLPTVAVLVGILLNRNDSNKLDVRLGAVESRLDARMSSIKVELDARISGLENRLHSDMLLVIGKLTELEVRVTRLEEKQNR